MLKRSLPRACTLATLAWPALATAQASEPVTLGPVVVTATRTETPAFDVPASIDRIDGASIRDSRVQVNLSESLGPVPGLVARDRQNYAQDAQISVRGFGARSTFGIRGVRLYVDGIPATLPDGQGQLSNIDLGSAERIEVLRGPFSALYGNSSGGVIQVFTEEGSGPPAFSGGIAFGSDDVRRLALKASGSGGPNDSFSYLVSGSEFKTDGYRDHSAAERRVGNVKLTWKPLAATKLTFVLNSVDLPKADDPLGLTRAQFDTEPRSVDPSAKTFDTRKTVDQTQGGAIWEQGLGAAGSLRALVYHGHRNTEQFQSIPVATQSNPLHPGGVISLGRDYSGADLRWATKTTLGGAPFGVVAGLAYDTLKEDRQGYTNFVSTTLGVRGVLRRDETNHARNVDEYLQASWQWTPQWSLNAGVRHSNVRFESNDHFIVATNPDDSGQVRLSATLPVVGVLFAASENVRLYATAGRGFETPTINELAYRPSGATGLNLGLQPGRSTSVEAGVKTRWPGLAQANAALFQTNTHDEIVTQTNVGGRATFQNAGATRRRGLELSGTAELGRDLRSQLAYTWLDARYRDAFATCAATPCPTPTLVVPAGNRIPGIARQTLYATLAWTPSYGWRGGIEGRASSRVWVNDANSDAAGGYATASLYAGYLAKIGPCELSGFGRVDNVFARHYAGSVIVGEGNARYFEPAPGRTWTLGVSGLVRF